MDMLVRLYNRLKLLPLTILIILIAFFLRLQDARQQLVMVGAAAQAEAKKDETHKDDTAKDEKDAKKDEKADDKKGGAVAEKTTPTPAEESDAAELDKPNGDDMRPNREIQILQDMAERRKQLDARAAALDEREALLKASEAQFGQKAAELNALRDEIKNLLASIQTREDDQTKSLVALYEKMKPKEAAVIFNTMDPAVLMTIAGNMKETKLSPVMAVMDAKKAQLITAKLAERTKVLPKEDAAAAKAALGNTAPAGAMPPAPVTDPNVKTLPSVAAEAAAANNATAAATKAVAAQPAAPAQSSVAPAAGAVKTETAPVAIKDTKAP